MDGSGAIDYNEFASQLYGRPMSASPQKSGNRSPEELAEALR
jgi:hypothetical protein